MKKSTIKKAKETFYVIRTTVVEETIAIEAANEGEAVRLASKGQGEVIGTDTHVHVRLEE